VRAQVLAVACWGALAAVGGCSAKSHALDGAVASGDAPSSTDASADAPAANDTTATVSTPDASAEPPDASTDAPPPDAPAPPPAAAPRLFPWELQPDGTPALLMGIYDRQENAHCRFVPDEAGQLRCLPWSRAPLVETATFSDPQCQKRVYELDPRAVDALVRHATALALPRVACAPKRYAVGTLVAFDGPRFGGTPCAALANAPGPGGSRVLLAVDKLEAPARWVTGTEIDGALVAGRLRVRRVAAADGARFDDHLVDEKWSRPCGLTLNLDRNVTCAPAMLGGGTAYHEGVTCTGPGVYRAGACDDPAFVGSVTSAAAFALGPVWKGAVSSRPGMGGCRTEAPFSTADGPDVYVEAGAPLGADAILPGMVWKLGGTGRLRLRSLPADDGSLVTVPNDILFGMGDVLNFHDELSRYFDTTTNRNCSAVRTPDGVLRCIPTMALASPGPIGFSDPACTKPIFFCPGYVPCTGQVVVSASLEPNGDVNAFTLMSAQAVTMTFLKLVSGECSSPGLGAPTMVFAPGPTQATWGDFPTLRERNAPAVTD
jgi:hypothetical protein